MCYLVAYRRRMEQSVARRAHNPKVVGSNPTPATIIFDGVFLFIKIMSKQQLCKKVYILAV